MNIVFALYNDFNCNSASHVHNFANELTKLGHDCVVAVPANKKTIVNLGTARYKAVEFDEAIRDDFPFSNGRGPDLLHAWTPREVVRPFCQIMQQRFGCRLFIHMEDNEWHLVACALGIPWERLVMTSDEELEAVMQPHLSHPRRGFEFLSSADGISIIIDPLRELVPHGIPLLEIWPSAEKNLFRPLPKLEHARSLLKIPKNSAVIAYTGNVHLANAHEMRSLYLAVAILNREGQPTTLVRAGRDFYPFLGPGEHWARRYSIELGLVPHKDVPAVLALADILVQPGRSDAFNDYRFPSKLPEFLSAGRPVVLPKTNLARHMIDGKHAFILSDASALSIVDAVRQILADPQLRERLARGALQFFDQHLSWTRSAEKLSDFYQANSRSECLSTLPPEADPVFSLSALAKATGC